MPQKSHFDRRRAGLLQLRLRRLLLLRLLLRKAGGRNELREELLRLVGPRRCRRRSTTSRGGRRPTLDSLAFMRWYTRRGTKVRSATGSGSPLRGGGSWPGTSCASTS